MIAVAEADARLLACVPALVTCLSRYLDDHALIAEIDCFDHCDCLTCAETRIALALVEEVRS